MIRLALVAAICCVVGCGDDGGTTLPTDGNDGADGAPGDGVPGDGSPGDGSPGDGPPMMGDASVGTPCGTTTCTSNQECCVEAGGRTCVDQGNCSGVALGCDGPEDCAGGEVCCAGGGGGPGGGGTECRNANQCNANVCHEMADCGGTQMCCPIQQLGISMCLAQCP